MLLTVFTPTYNRAQLLMRVYNSLNNQKNKDFEWLIVDDGSTDETKEVVNSWIKEDKINIRYIYQKNAGKAIAFNTGVINAKGKLLLCVDSDDYLTEDAVEAVSNAYNKISGENIAGIIALKTDLQGNILGDKLPEDMEYTDTFSLREKYHCKGEWTLIYKTDILRENLFPKIENEKFITECVIYDKIAQKYKMFLLNNIITICEYQADGYTSNIIANMIKNPTGYKIYYSQRIDMALTLRKRIGYIIRYCAFNKMSEDKRYTYKGKYKILVILLKFIGIIGEKYYYRKVK